ncbi:MAG: cytochrome c biogenesis protein ResB, partial [Nitrospirota bacterium]
ANEKSFVDKIWDLFASVKLAAITFGLIALSSIIGTIIEQGGEPEKNLQILQKMFGESLAPSLYRISEKLGFMDMYHSWWFISFLVLFTTNLIICSLDRLPRILKIVRQPVHPLPEEKFSTYTISREIQSSSSAEPLRDSLRTAIKRFGFNATEVSESGTVQFYADKGAWSRLGVYITHLSILLILVGAVIGIFFGFNGFLNLPEGYSSQVAYARNGGTAHELGFTIKLDDFDVEFYEGKDMPKDYKSWLTVLKNGREVKKQAIEVNTPLRFDGYTFYQSSYGAMPNPQGLYIIRATSNTGKSEVLNLSPGESFKIPGTEIVINITDFNPAIAFRQDGSTFTYSDMMNNPGILIDFNIDGEQYSGWILKRYPRTWDIPQGHRVEFIDYWGAQYTGLQVRKDPGVVIVYLACLIMAIGLYSAFFMSHKKLWVMIKGSSIHIAATANKNRQSYERDIDKLVNNIENSI